jgi:hypothetical protein
MQDTHDLKKCKFCGEELGEILVLPCGATICRKHANCFFNDEPIDCRFCDQPHIKPEQLSEETADQE